MRSTQFHTHSRHSNLLFRHNYYRCAYSCFRYFLGYSQYYRRLCLNGPLKLSSNWTFRQNSWRCWNSFRMCLRAEGHRIHHPTRILMCPAWEWMGLSAHATWSNSQLMIRKIFDAIFSTLMTFYCPTFPYVIFFDLWHHGFSHACVAMMDPCSVFRNQRFDSHKDAVQNKKINKNSSSSFQVNLHCRNVFVDASLCQNCWKML